MSQVKFSIGSPILYAFDLSAEWVLFTPMGVIITAKSRSSVKTSAQMPRLPKGALQYLRYRRFGESRSQCKLCVVLRQGFLGQSPPVAQKSHGSTASCRRRVSSVSGSGMPITRAGGEQEKLH